jgi:Leucine-rich repeat (LRR) protein
MRPHRKLFRLSLRALLVLVTILCLAFAKLSLAARRQQAAVAWVIKSGGRVTYDWQEGESRTFPAPAWLRSLLGDDYFQTPTHVTLTHLRGVDLMPLYQLGGLRSLNLTSDGLTDATPLIQFRELRELTLTDNELTSLEPAAQLRQLTTLTVDYNAIEDVTPLAALKNLKSLNVEHNKIRNVRPLTELTKLRKLNIATNPITDPASLHELRQLATLKLGRNGFAEAQTTELQAALPNTAIEETTIAASLAEP